MPRAQASHATYEYVPEFGRAVRILEYDRPMRSDDEETAQTVSYMDELATRDANEAAVENATAEALEFAGLDASADDFSKACAVYWWLKRTVRYVATPGTSPLVDQTLIPPCTILAMPEPIGDCPQFSMLAAAMFRCLCMNSRFVTIAAEREFPDQWSHIYNTVEVAPGVYMPFDSSNGPEPGAEYARPYKKKVWPRLSPGKCQTKEKSPMLRGTHRNTFRGMRSASLRGTLGACDADGNCYDDQTDTYTPAPIAPEIPGGYGYISPSDALSMSNLSESLTASAPLPALIPTSRPVSIAAPAGNSIPWYDSLITDAANAFSSVNASNQKPYYITSPSGQSVLYNPNTGTVSTPQTLASAINPTYLALGVGALVLFAVLGKK